MDEEIKKIDIDERIVSSKRIIEYLTGDVPVDPGELALRAYNAGVADILAAIVVFADKNPQYKLPFLSLKKELEIWKLVLEREEL